MTPFPSDAPLPDLLISCPECEGSCRVAAATDSCAFFHECECCGVLIRALDGDCCVVCSYGAVSCLPKQAEVNEQRRD